MMGQMRWATLAYWSGQRYVHEAEPVVCEVRMEVDEVAGRSFYLTVYYLLLSTSFTQPDDSRASVVIPLQPIASSVPA
jgi:hypothetical protein